jgi:TonB family protein
MNTRRPSIPAPASVPLAFVLLATLAWTERASCGPIHTAADSCDVKTAKALLKKDHELVFVKDDKGRTALHHAANHGCKEIAEALLAGKADPNAKDNSGWTPLHIAADDGRRAIAELLLGNKVEVDAKTTDGKTPLHLAALNGHKDIAELLLAFAAQVDAKDDRGWTALHQAVQKGHKDVVELLLAKGGDVNAKTVDGVTPLIVAAANDRAATIESLLASKPGIDMNAQGSTDGWTPLHWAAYKGYKDVVQLLGSKAEINPRAKDGKTPLHLAAYGGHKDVAESLLAFKAQVDAKDGKGWTALHLAADRNQKDVVALLLANGADVNARLPEGLTPLHLATRNHGADAAKLLLAGGADVNAKDNKGEATLHVAAKYGYRDVAESLIAAKADVNIKDANGATPLLIAAAAGHEDLAILLLANKASADVKEANGNTPLGYAVGGKKYAMGNAQFLNALVAGHVNITTAVLSHSELIKWSSFGGSLATQADIERLRTAGAAQFPGLSNFMINGYVSDGRSFLTDVLFVGQDALDLAGRKILPSRFSLGAQGGLPVADLSKARGDQLFLLSVGTNNMNLISVGSVITPPAGEFVMLGGRFVRSGTVIVKEDGFELEPGSEVLQDLPPISLSPTSSSSDPVLLSKVEPDYSEEARRAKWNGDIRAFITIDEEGNVSSVQVLNSPGLGLDEKVVAALRQWKFKPAMKEGVPVGFRVEVTVTLRLL